MKKTVYSVVLSDEVIEKIDRLTYMHNTNRSNMINQILADYVSLTTPEKRNRDIFEELSELLCAGNNFREMLPPTHSVCSLASALCYKYNPTVRYSVELYRETSKEQGKIKVSVRTTNAVLIDSMIDFFCLWENTERKFGVKGNASFADGVYCRPIVLRKSPFCDEFYSDKISGGEIIARYISLFDRAMKIYFDDDTGNSERISELYYSYLRENGRII